MRHEGAGSVNLNPDLRRTSHGRLCLGAIGGLARGRPYFQGMERPRPREKAFIEKPRPGQGLEGASKPHHRRAISIGLGLVAQAQRLRKCKGLCGPKQNGLGTQGVAYQGRRPIQSGTR